MRFWLTDYSWRTEAVNDWRENGLSQILIIPDGSDPNTLNVYRTDTLRTSLYYSHDIHNFTELHHYIENLEMDGTTYELNI